MLRANDKKNLQIATIPNFQPIRCITDQSKFLNPSTHQQMWDNVHLLMNFYNRGGCLSPALTQKIIEKAMAIIKNQPNLLYLSDPIHLVGDIHGQFYDLVEHLDKMNIYSLIINNHQNPLSKRKKVLFLGDYVDRGNFSVEVTILLFVLKIYQPKTFFLLRGNHQCRQITQIYNFKRQCQSKYKNQPIYNLFIDLFWVLPLAAVVNGTYFCVHGGLSQDLKSISDIEKVNRFKEIPRKGLMCDMLWSDPVDDKKGQVKMQKDSEFNRIRNCSIRFGDKLIRKFFRQNDIMCVIRAHQVQEQGYGFINWGEKQKFPDIITLFSAPNYCGGRNKGAIAYIDVTVRIMKKNGLELFPIEKKAEPFVFPNFINGFEVSVPFMIAYVTEMFFCLLSSDSKIEDNHNGGVGSVDSLDLCHNNKQIKREVRKSNQAVLTSQNLINKGKSKCIESNDQLVEQGIMEKQQYLLDVYSMAKNYISSNISFKLKLQDSRSLIFEAREARLTP